MSITEIEFSEFEQRLSETGKSSWDYLAPKIGKVYAIAITRDGCSACEKQKPKLNKLATTLTEKYGNKIVFTRVHVRYFPGSEEESLRSKDMFGHYFYPNNMILFRTRNRGAIVYYRNAAPEMKELEKNIQIALEIAMMIEKESV